VVIVVKMREGGRVEGVGWMDGVSKFQRQAHGLHRLRGKDNGKRRRLERSRVLVAEVEEL
jgi:hypothetical protein